MKPNNQKANTTNIILIVILVLLLIGGGVYFVATKKPSSHPVKPAPTQSTQPIQQIKQNQHPSVSDETANWKTYRNEKYGFEVKYPKKVKINGKDQTIVFKEFNSPTHIFSGEIEPSDFLPGSTGLLYIRISRPSNLTNLNDYLKEKKCIEGSKDSAAGVNCGIENTTLGNKKALDLFEQESSAVGNTSVTIFTEKNGYLFEVKYDYEKGILDGYQRGERSKYFQREKNLYDIKQKMLSTFRFIK